MVSGDFGAATVRPQFAAITTMHAAPSIGCVQHGARRLRGTLTPQSRRSFIESKIALLFGNHLARRTGVAPILRPDDKGGSGYADDGRYEDQRGQPK
jgi:hypothetical protein